MILDTIRTNSIEGNMPVRSKTKMTISEIGADILMDNLSNLYNDPLLAVIREYYANGYDSHKVAGTTRPVEITLPSEYTPSFIVRDFGTGMSEDFINDVYSVYGESTKREGNDTIGAFGLGGKSAFSVAEQYTVTSFHEGKKISVLFQKGEEGSFDVIVVSVLETDEPNGVIVTVPIDRNSIRTFNARAMDFFRYTDPGSVLINGKQPDFALEGEDLYTLEEDDIKVVFNFTDVYSSSRVNFVMGGIPYAISSQELAESFSRVGHRGSWNGMDINFIVPLASFNLTGNREGVRATPKTKALLDRATTIFTKGLRQAAQSAVDAATDYPVVLDLSHMWGRYLSKDLTWRGKEISVVARTKKIDDVHNKAYLSVQESSYSSKKATYTNGLDLRSTSAIILGKDPEEFEKSNVRHAGIYMRNIDTKVYRMVVVSSLEDYFEDADLPRIRENSNFKFITFDDFRADVRAFEAKRRADAKALRLANGPAVKAPPKPKPSFPVLDLSTRTVVWTGSDEISDKDTAYLWSQDMKTPYDPTRGARRTVTSYVSKSAPSQWKNPTPLSEALSHLTEARFIVLLSGAKNPASLKKHTGKSIPSVVVEAKKRSEDCINEANDVSVTKLNAAESKEVKKLRSDLGSEYIERIEDPDLKGMIQQDEAVVEASPALLDGLLYLGLVDIDAYMIRNRLKSKTVNVASYDQGEFDFAKRYPLLPILQTGAWYANKEQYEEIVEYLNTKYRSTQTLTVAQ